MPKTLRQLKEEYLLLLEDLNANLRAQLDMTQGANIPGSSKGAVYVIRQSGTGNYKIGFSTNYPQRKALFDVRLPFPIEETFVHYTDSYREIERALHAILAEYRLNDSEFFALSEDQVASLPHIIQE